MKNKLLTLAAAGFVALSLTACSSSSTSTSTITVNGKTTTTTTITENGTTASTTVTEVASETTEAATKAADTVQAAVAAEAAETTEAADTAETTDDYDPNDPSGLRAKWAELFTGGAEGQNADGDRFLYAYDDVNEPTFASMVIVTEGGTKLDAYYIGEVAATDEGFEITDLESGNGLPYGYADSENEETYCLTFKDGDIAEVTPVDVDTIINDMAAIVENMYLVNLEVLQEGLYRTDVYTSQVPLDGCDTFTDVVDKNLGNGQAYANITLGDTDVLLLSDDAFEFEGTAQAVSAEVFYYNEGKPAYAGFVRSGGSANPLMINDGKLYAAGHHYVGRFIISNGEVEIDGEAFVTYDVDGNPTWHYNADGGTDYSTLDQESAQKAFDDLYAEYMDGEIVEFSIVNK